MTITAIREAGPRRASWWAPVGWYASLLGWGARRSIPRPLRAPMYGAFARAVGADLGEAELAAAEYPTFGEFFARRLREGARSLHGADDVVAAPCDGALAIAGTIDDGTLIQAKGHTYRLQELLACDERTAARFDGGWTATIYLSPADYHRVHAPVAGVVTAVDHVPGTLWPVKPFFTRNVSGLFAKNERAVIHLETQHGPVAVCMIAAVGVGHIELVHVHERWSRREHLRVELARPAPVARGDELGAFHLGSTVVMVFPPGMVVPAARSEPGPIRVGQPLGRIA